MLLIHTMSHGCGGGGPTAAYTCTLLFEKALHCCPPCFSASWCDNHITYMYVLSIHVLGQQVSRLWRWWSHRRLCLDPAEWRHWRWHVHQLPRCHRAVCAGERLQELWSGQRMLRCHQIPWSESVLPPPDVVVEFSEDMHTCMYHEYNDLVQSQTELLWRYSQRTR